MVVLPGPNPAVSKWVWVPSEGPTPTFVLISPSAVIVLADATSGEYQVTEIHIIHDGTNVNISQFGTVFAGGSTELATFSADISGSDVRLRVTPASANSTVIKWERSLQSA